MQLIKILFLLFVFFVFFEIVDAQPMIKSTVRIEYYDDNDSSPSNIGAGIVVAYDGISKKVFIVTAAHVLQIQGRYGEEIKHENVKVNFSHRRNIALNVEKALRDQSGLDLAILQVQLKNDKEFEKQKFFFLEEPNLALHQNVRNIGHPYGKGWVVNGPNKIESIINNGRAFQLTNNNQEIVEGCSGGPVFTTDNKIIGMITNTVSNQAEGISIETIMKRMNSDPWNINYRQMSEIFEIPVQGNTQKIQGGIFTMGERKGEKDARPQRDISISSFEIDIYETTNAEFTRFLNEKGTKDKNGAFWYYRKNGGIKKAKKGKFVPEIGKENFPATSITYHGAVEYCKWRGSNFRPPTEAEWEYAARSNNSYKYSGSNEPKEVAWYKGNSLKSPHEVTTKVPNAFGIFHMSGNVKEWCFDNYGPYDPSLLVDPKGKPFGEEKVIRGGSWMSKAKEIGIKYRDKLEPQSKKNKDVGCRCVKSGT